VGVDRDTFSDLLRFPSLVLVPIFNNIDLNEQKPFIGLLAKEKVTTGTNAYAKFRLSRHDPEQAIANSGQARCVVHDAKTVRLNRVDSICGIGAQNDDVLTSMILK
jgi:hypothetical protein